MKKNILIALSFSIAICSTALYVLSHNASTSTHYEAEKLEGELIKERALEITQTEHVLGNPNATTKIILYSSANCQHCRSLYWKLKNIVSKQPSDVVLVYRQIPISFSRGRVDESEIAAECAYIKGGSLGFFKYLDTLFQTLPPNIQMPDISNDDITNAATAASVTDNELKNCAEDNGVLDAIALQHRSGEILSVGPIPHTIIVSNESVYNLVGNKSEDTFQTIISQLKKQ